MNTEKRLIVAIVLFVLVMYFWQGYLRRFAASPVPAETGEEQTPWGAKARLETKMLREMPAALAPTVMPTQPFATQRVVPQVVADNVCETDTLRLTFSGLNGAIINIGLKKYPDPSTGASQEVFNAVSPDEGALALQGLGWPLEPARVTQGAQGPVYTYLTDANWKITKKYILENAGYAIQLRLGIENLAAEQRDIKYKLLAGSNINQDSYMAERFTQAVILTGEKVERVGVGKVKNKEAVYTGEIGWVALRGKYYALALKSAVPDQAAFVAGLENGPEEKKGYYLLAGIGPAGAALLGNSSLSKEYFLYAGPNKHELLSFFGAVEVASFGKLDVICKLLLKTLNVLYKIVHNYGTAIILLTFLVSVILYPLTWKSVTSMKRMQAFQPHMKKIQIEHKGNPQKLNKELMEFYRKHKINPLGGCLPLFLQMPIFIALYQVLMRSIELKGAKFLWIKDLSAPDAAFRLPFTLPVIGSAINILPFLMIVAMLFQQKAHAAPAATPEQQQQQKMMGLMMPILMGFIFYNMPSGFILYILVSTGLTLFYHRLADVRGMQTAPAGPGVS